MAAEGFDGTRERTLARGGEVNAHRNPQSAAGEICHVEAPGEWAPQHKTKVPYPDLALSLIFGTSPLAQTGHARTSAI